MARKITVTLTYIGQDKSVLVGVSDLYSADPGEKEYEVYKGKDSSIEINAGGDEGGEIIWRAVEDDEPVNHSVKNLTEESEPIPVYRGSGPKVAKAR